MTDLNDSGSIQVLEMETPFKPIDADEILGEGESTDKKIFNPEYFIALIEAEKDIPDEELNKLNLAELNLLVGSIDKKLAAIYVDLEAERTKGYIANLISFAYGSLGKLWIQEDDLEALKKRILARTEKLRN